MFYFVLIFWCVLQLSAEENNLQLLEENAKCKEENQRMSDIISNNMKELYARVSLTEDATSRNAEGLNALASRAEEFSVESLSGLALPLGTGGKWKKWPSDHQM